MFIRKSTRRRRLARDLGAPQPPLASAARPQHRLSRGVLLTGTSALALILAAPDGALARPFGSAAAISAPTFASDVATATSQQAAAVAKQSQNALARAAQAIQALQAVQAAARNAAQSAGASRTLPQVVVPNGLAPGGLQVAPGATAGSSLWQGADLPTQSASGGQTNVTVNQTSAQAILNWQTFNVGAQTTVNFNQQASNWTALNRVIGNLGPSQILGNIKAPGQVLVINQNGIIFGGASQINAGSLIASTAGITDQQFLTKGIYSNSSGSGNNVVYTPSFTGAGGKIIVESGAQITTNAPASVTSGGGFVLLMGTEVDNAGSITTAKGQTMLAAGDDFILRQGYGTDSNQYSTTRGNEVAPVLYAGSSSGAVDNTGLVFAQQGDITLAGHTIVQDGILLSTTSVNQRGTIHLLNSASDATGSVQLTGSSFSLILPELGSSDTALNSQRDALIAASGVNALAIRQFDNLSALTDRKDQSRVEIVTGGLVDFQNGSQTMAEGGQVSVSAGKRVLAESGSTIDVSGTTGAVLAASANTINVNIQGNELRDSPQNRDGGVLINSNVWIDARDLTLVPAGTGGYATDRYYTAGGLLEVSGYLNNTGHTIGEWTAVGGTITLAAPQVVAQQGSTFNISGGAVQYQGGYMPQTYLLGSDGRIYNVNTAPADLTYLAVANGFVVTHSVNGKIDPKLTQVYLSPFGHQSVQWQDGYTVGRDAGSLLLSTPTAIFEGSILAAVIDGERQVNARPAGVTDGYKFTQNTVPLAGTLALGQYNGAALLNAYATNVIFGTGGASVAGSVSASAPVPANVANTAYFDAAAINSFNLGGVSIATRGSIVIDAPLTFAPGAQVKLFAPIVDIAASITAPSGSVTIANIVPAGLIGSSATTLTTAGGLAQLTLEAGAGINTRGLWTNALIDPDDLSGLAFVNGGSVTFDSSQGVVLAAGSTIDVSSGAAILASGKTVGGKSGNVTLTANDPLGSGSASTAPLVLGGAIRAYGVNGGGTLAIGASSVLIASMGTATAAGQVLLTPDFLRSGFSNYNINGNSGVTVANGTQINVVEPLYRFTDVSSAAPTGSDPSSVLQTWLPPLYLEDATKAQLIQRAGASIALRSITVAAGGGLSIGQGAAISVDSGQSVTLDAFGQITVDGTITAHGGAIKIISEANYATQAGLNFDSAGNPLGRSIWIGDHASLDVSGLAYTALDLSGRAYGVAGNGGSIQIGGVAGVDQASGALLSTSSFVVIRPGAVLDASGASAVIDPNAGTGAGGDSVSPLTIAGGGGSIAFDSSSGIYLDGTLRAVSGGAGAPGGSLSITLETPVYLTRIAGVVPTVAQRPSIMTITQDAQASGLPADLASGTNSSALKFGQAKISADAITAGGFDNVSLFSRDAFLFAGNVTLKADQSIKLYQGALADTAPTANVTIAAPYVLFGGHTGIKSDFAIYPSLSLTPSSASTQAAFNVAADLIDFQNDVQFLASGRENATGYNFAGFQSANFISQGDVRFLAPVATLAGIADATRILTPGSLVFTAAQLYPVTGASAVVSAGDSIAVGRISNVDPGMPMSVFGRLALAAGTIHQGGIIRAPLGVLAIGAAGYTPFGGISAITKLVELLPGSITSVSAGGLVIPYGGTTDGLTYSYGGNAVQPISFPTDVFGRLIQGVSLAGKSVDVQSGATLDLSGGGALTGRGFISGRGGSVDILTTPLVNANPSNTFSAGGNKVYAIVPSYRSGYAPIAVENGAGDPAIGQQITIPAGVPGLPAGTYTLLPSNYALLPGAYRVEIGASISSSPASSASPLGNGSYNIAGYKSVANTSVKDALPTQLIITAADAVRRYSQYNEQSYSNFMVASAALFGQPRPVLPADAKTLMIQVVQPDAGSTTPSFNFDGTTLFQPAAGGFGGTAIIGGGSSIEAYARGAAPTAGFNGVSLDAADINAIDASRLVIGGYEYLLQGTPQIHVSTLTGNLFIRSGVTLSAGEVVLTGSGGITVESGATISTIGRGPAPFDSSNGYVYVTESTALVLSNGDLNLISSGGNGAISIGAGAALYSEGTLAFATNGVMTIDPMARYGTKSLQLAASNINVGDGASLGATVPSGIGFDQTLFDRLVAGAGAGAPAGVPALQQLVLGAGKSMNFYGTTGLDASGTNIQLVLNTPAIYGYGASTDTASLKAGTLVWSGVGGATLPAIAANGAGTGLGTLDISAGTIILGYSSSAIPNGRVSLDRTTYGFSNVNLTATQEVISNNKGSLSVYQAPSGAPGAVFGKSGIGGDLNINAPLLTGTAGSIMAYAAGGVLNVIAPAGAAATPPTGNLGAEIDLAGANVNIASAIILPSGKLVVTANTGDVAIDAGAVLDLSGRASTIQDQTVYGFGGDVVLSSTHGNIIQGLGSTIDVSAVGNAAGSVTATAIDAAAGQVVLIGTLRGGSTLSSGISGGFITISAQTLQSGNAANLSSDFAALNTGLSAAGFSGSRAFDLRQGNLTIGNEVRAHSVTISVDGGSLTVNGTIDASGIAPGTIRLAARDDLELAASGKLDAHGRVLQVDSYGQPIEAKNRGTIELNTKQGVLRLDTGAAMDVSVTSPQGAVLASSGQIDLNAPRGTIGTVATSRDETSGDIKIDASGALTIIGARSIAVNGFWTYNLPGGSVITQATLDVYDTASTAFINAALGAAGLQAGLPGRLAGLTAYGSAFHLRPGVEITSSGDLSTSGDIDLSRYRYGPAADRNTASAGYGAGEPMSLAIRAAGNLDIKGSLSDGFKSKPSIAGVPPTYTTVVTAAGTVLDATLVFTDPVTLTTDWVVPNDNYYNTVVYYLSDTAGNAYNPGQTVPAGTTIVADGYDAFEQGVTLPGYSTSKMTDPGTPASPAAAATSAVAPMLAPGSLSTSIRLVAGADLAAADRRALQTTAALNGSGNLTLNDPTFNTSLRGDFSVVRTGTGSLEQLAGGNFSEATPFGVYTAGTDSAPILASDGSNPYDLLTTASGGARQAYYPEHGGDLFLSAQGNASGYISPRNGNTDQWFDGAAVGQWLWHQGGAIAGQSTAWWINFGSYVSYTNGPVMTGFQGIGTLGGGNLTVIAGGSAGTLNGVTNSGLNLAVASTGRVLADGTVVQTGGGDLTLRIGGALNPKVSNFGGDADLNGTLTDLRGEISIKAASIGVVAMGLGNGTTIDPSDPRPLDYRASELAASLGGPIVVPGDGTVTIATRGDLVLGGAGDAAMLNPVDPNGTPYFSGGSIVSKGGNGSFTLWMPTTAINLYSAGGNLSPGAASPTGSANQNNGINLYPATLTAVAASGNLYFSPPVDNQGSVTPIELAPSPIGQLSLLASGSIYGAGAIIAMSGADMSLLATPLNPVFGLTSGIGLTNASSNSAYLGISRNSPIAFGPDTPTTNLHENDPQPGLVYAGSDIVNLEIGYINTFTPYGAPANVTWYYGAKPFRIIAGRDIVGGAVPKTSGTSRSVNFFLNNNPDDISVVRAGRDIINESVTIGGPGQLDVQAGRNLYQGYLGSLESIGPLVNIDPSNRSNGASISVMAGVGAKGPDYADFAKLYFDPANQLPAGTPLDGSGKVAKTYGDELTDWLTQRFSPSQNFVSRGKSFVFTGGRADALAFFLSLPVEQQGVFVRQVYYAELTAGGREYNDPSSSRYRSYLRGRDAIAALFPDKDANGQPLAYTGDITMFSGKASYNGVGNLDPVFDPTHVSKQFDAGIRTDSGGGIQVLTPGGQTIVGVEGLTPGGNAGLLTQGSGDIDIYSLGSILLGQSRVMTTFGGNILAWSATGDINAGRGSKTTTVFTPPKRIYDNYGNVTLAPNVPSSGAGIATLNPIPQVPAGNIDLIAPLGTIDAGEAGIRVSGNINLAALQVLNAANIQVQGTSTGISTVQAPNISGALAASNTTAATQQTGLPAQSGNNGQPSVVIVEVLGYGGGGEDGSPDNGQRKKDERSSLENQSYDPRSKFQVIGNGELTNEEKSKLTEDERKHL